MKIVGVLSWYDELPQWLSTSVAGFSRVCDHIVAVDGAYALYPGARPCSHPAQAEAIMGAAEAAGVACTIHRPNRLFFGNEVEKRNLTFDLAAPFLSEGDWVMVFDADCHVFKVNPEFVRGELERTDALLANYTVLNVEYEAFDDPTTARVYKEDDYDYETTSRTNDIYRWHPSLRYGPQHWLVSREVEVSPGVKTRRWVRHGTQGVKNICQLNADLVVYHRSKDRAMARKKSQFGYYEARELHGIESDGKGRARRAGVK